jgi:NADH:ubiquinone oxidoreductase subunit 6 (subunit J)
MKEALVSTQQAGSSGAPAFSAAGAVTAQSAPPSKVTLVLGYVCAVLFPIVGFVIGLVVAIKHRGGAHNPGTGIMVTAVAVFLLSMFLIAAAGSAGA